MIRKAASVVVVLCLSSASLHADATKLTVSATSATVYKSPSVASPVVGHANRGAALDVTREVGDWVKVERGGDVIPKVAEIVSDPEHPRGKEPYVYPTRCPVCGSPADSPDRKNRLIENTTRALR